MVRLTVLIALISCLAVPLAAQEFRASNRVPVTGTSDTINVLGDGGFGARGIWCAAADYALRVLRVPGNTRLYVREARRTPPFVFTLDAAGAASSSVLVLSSSLRQPGSNLSVNHALGFCADAKLINR
ncbi:MAG: hypothetical protein AAF755_08260 [Pseudomonadota bacterium]